MICHFCKKDKPLHEFSITDKYGKDVNGCIKCMLNDTSWMKDDVVIKKKVSKGCCSVCGKPVHGNVNPEAILTCGKCVQIELAIYENKCNFIVDNVATGEQLKALRKSNRISQKGIAAKLNISVSYYRKLENNKRFISKELQRKIKELIKKGTLPNSKVAIS